MELGLGLVRFLEKFEVRLALSIKEYYCWLVCCAWWE